MVAPAQNVGAVVRRTLPKGGYEYIDRAESLGSVTHEMFIVGYTFGVRTPPRATCLPTYSCLNLSTFSLGALGCVIWLPSTLIRLGADIFSVVPREAHSRRGPRTSETASTGVRPRAANRSLYPMRSLRCAPTVPARPPSHRTTNSPAQRCSTATCHGRGPVDAERFLFA